MNITKFYDTNALLSLHNELDKLEFFYTSSKVLQEIENIKISKNKDDFVKYQARQVARYLKLYPDQYDVIVVGLQHYELLVELDLENNNDNLIMSCAKLLEKDLYKVDKDLVFVTDDINCWNVAKKLFKLNVESTSYSIKCNIYNDNYSGYHELKLDLNNEDDERYLSRLYSLTGNKDFNFPTQITELLLEKDVEIKTNQYLIIYDQNKTTIDKFKWNGSGLDSIKYKTIDNRYIGKIKPRNLQQELLFDMMQDDDIKVKVCTGGYGTGKDFIMTSIALSLLEKGKYDKIVWVRNVQEVKDSGAIGFLPGDANEKLLPYAMVLADKVGGTLGVEYLLRNQQLELQHLSTIRGRDIKNAIVYCTEMQNMTASHIQLILGRMGEGSVLYMNGDLKQTDAKVFENNSGLRKMIDKLVGNKNFGLIRLEKTERSEVAEMAALLED